MLLSSLLLVALHSGLAERPFPKPQLPEPRLPQHPGLQGPASRATAPVRLETLAGGTLLLMPRTQLVLEVLAGALDKRSFRLAVGTPPEARVEGLAELITIPADAAGVRLPCAMLVEAGRPAGPLRCEIILCDPETGEVLLRNQVTLTTALGRDFMRLDFEGAAERRFERRPGPVEAVAKDAEVTSGPSRPGWCGARALRIEAIKATARHETFEARSVADGCPLERFPWLTLAVRGNGVGRAAVRVSAGERVIEIPLAPDAEVAASAFGGDEWRKIVISLPREFDRGAGTVPMAVTALALVLHGSGTVIEVDEVALTADPEVGPADRLRDLCQRYVATNDAEEHAALAKQLATIDPERLDHEAAVDHVLLGHALALDTELSGLPAKQRGQPTGEARFAALVRHQQMLAETPKELIALGWEAVLEHQKQLAELAPKIVPGKSWREVVKVLRSRHPNAAELPRLAEQNWIAARDFTIAHDLVTVPLAARHGIVDPITDGPLSHTYAFGGYGGARPSPQGFTGTFMVSPPAVWMDERQAQERLRGNHYAWCRVVALHEMVPGHHLQTVVHEMRPLSAFRRRFYSTLFAEGWALYCERVLADAGYCDAPDVHFAWLQMRLWRAARIVMDASLQTGRMSKEAAVAFFVTEAALLPENARAEIARDIDAPTRPLSYYMGYLKIEELEREVRTREGAEFSGRAFRDRLLSFGPIPLAAIRKGFGL